MKQISILRKDKRKQKISLEFKGEEVFKDSSKFSESRCCMNINWIVSLKKNDTAVEASLSAESKFNILHGPAEVEIELNINNKETEELVFEENITKTFTTKKENVKIFTKDIKDFIIPKNEYKLDCEITVIKLMGTVQPKPFNILEKKGFEDGIIVFDDKKEMAVNKLFLSTYSPYFYKRFYQEKNNNFKAESEDSTNDSSKDSKIPKYLFSEVSSDEFKEMIDILPPVNSQINESNYSYLIKLSNRFKIGYIMDLCEQYIINKMSTQRKNMENIDHIVYLKLVDEYYLWNVLDECLTGLTFSTFREKVSQDNFDELSEKTKARIVETFFYSK